VLRGKWSKEAWRQIEPEIPKLLAAMKETRSDMVLGSRFLAASGYRSTAGRRLGTRLFSSIVSALCGARITDATSGFRAWNRRAMRILAKQYPEDYPEVEAILIAQRAGLRIAEVPVRMQERTAGRSSLGIWEVVTYLIKVPLAMLMNLVRKRDPQSS